MQGECERLRTTRIDDALLIEKMRAQTGEIAGAVNEVVGVILHAVKEG